MVNTLPLLLETPNKAISCFEITATDIAKTIKALNANKAHGDDEISIRMLKLCESVISEPLHLIFKNRLASNTFSDVWKKVNATPVYKKVINKC